MRRGNVNSLYVCLSVYSVIMFGSLNLHLYAVKLLRARGMYEEALQQVFSAVIVSKICLKCLVGFHSHR